MTTAPVREGYYPTIGLEIHVELATATKMFCSCANMFGDEPNTNVCPTCLGLPGSLPVLNQRAVELALRFGVALGFGIPTRSIFHRKNYFYPDMPKDFQTSQFDEPICVDGTIEALGTVVQIERAHLEEDTGKSTHIGGSGRIADAEYSLVDYNRAGVPLMEIVSRPDIHSAEQARAYVAELRAVLEALDISDVKMEEGSLRVDANVSVAPEGATQLGTRAEIKNMNSLRSLGRAIDYEIDRQIALLQAGERVVQETRHWDEADGRTHSMRSKEMAFDYRYFPEPDLVPIVVTDEMRAVAHAAQVELPSAVRARLAAEWEISEHDASTLVAVPGLVAFATAAVEARSGTTTPKEIVNWCVGDVLGAVNESDGELASVGLTPERLAELVGLVGTGTLSRAQAKQVFSVCLSEGGSPQEIAQRLGLSQVSDESALRSVLEALIAAHPDEVHRWKNGDEAARKKLNGFFMGQAMRELKGQGNPNVLTSLLGELLAN